MNDSSAVQAGYHAGQVIGAILVIVFIIVAAIGFVLSLVKAITTRRTGWIITACLTGVPVLILIGLFMVGMAVGFSRGFHQSLDEAAAKRGDMSPLLTADMTSVAGTAIPYTISIPLYSQWQDKGAHPPYDRFLGYNDAFVGIIAEGVGLGTPERVRDFSEKNITEKATDYSFTPALPITIDSRTWLTYDVAATMSGINIKYRFYVYADSNYTIQIITWTGPVLFDRYAPVFDRIAKSFQFTK